jgi:hypothetical protein
MHLTWSLVLALQFARAEKSEASRRAYRSVFELFSRWRQRNWDPTFSILGINSSPGSPHRMSASHPIAAELWHCSEMTLRANCDITHCSNEHRSPQLFLGR